MRGDRAPYSFYTHREKNMKYKLLVVFILFFVSFGYACAHGGVEKHDDNVRVFLKQEPLSPLVGEEVKFYFTFTDAATDLALKNLPVTLTLIDTFPGDESKDTEIFSQDMTTDVNGSLDFTYTFTKENYFDIDLDFIDPTTKASGEVGFLVESRIQAATVSALAMSYGEQIHYMVIGAIVGVAIAYLIFWRRKIQKN